MLKKSSYFKVFPLLIFVFLVACSNSVQNSQTIKQSESKAAVIQVIPSPFPGKTAKIRGEYSPIKITENLKDSVEQQDLPKIWLEFEQENGEVLKTELDEKLNENLKTAGEALLHYQYIKYHSENHDELANAAYNHSITFVNSLNEIRKSEINSPDGKRILTEEEAAEILSKQAGLINDRYFELDDHFNPKSAFYKFKKSVNKKLGYSIF